MSYMDLLYDLLVRVLDVLGEQMNLFLDLLGRMPGG
jgi:hypothetical protein